MPGIKVHKGAKPLALADRETITKGLDGLRVRLEEYRGLGTRFAKWRATCARRPESPGRRARGFLGWHAHDRARLPRHLARARRALYGVSPACSPVRDGGISHARAATRWPGRRRRADVQRCARTAGAPACLPAATGEVGGDQAAHSSRSRSRAPRRPRDPRRQRPALSCQACSASSIAGRPGERRRARPGAGRDGRGGARAVLVRAVVSRSYKCSISSGQSGDPVLGGSRPERAGRARPRR